MTIVLKIEPAGGYGGGPTHQVAVDGKEIRTIGDLCECPEDAIVGRDLVDGYDIVKYIQMGYDAAKRGEVLEVEEMEVEEFD